MLELLQRFQKERTAAADSNETPNLRKMAGILLRLHTMRERVGDLGLDELRDERHSRFRMEQIPRDKEQGTRSVTDERGAPAIEDKNNKQIAMYHASDGKAWAPDDRFLPASAQTSEGLIKGSSDTKRNQELIPIHWKVVDAATGNDVVPGETKRFPMFSGCDRDDTWRQFRSAAERAWVQVGFVQRGYYNATARNLNYQTLAENIQAEHPGIRKTLVRSAMLKDVSGFAEAFARMFISHPKAAKLIRAFDDYMDNLTKWGDDVNFRAKVRDETFGGTRFQEYLDEIVTGINQHFVCQFQGCASFFPGDQWLQGYNANGSEEAPNLWQFRCPMCFQAYAKGRLNEGYGLKNCWDGQPRCEAEKIMAVQDMRQHAIKHTQASILQGKWADTITMLPNQSASSSSSTATASGTAEAANTVATMQKDGWKFFLLEWEDKITANLLTELKCIWHDVAEQCNNNPMEDLLQTTLRMAKEMEQPSYFKKTAVPEEFLQRCVDHNKTGKTNFTTKLFRRD